jgi:hypothetical protein
VVDRGGAKNAGLLFYWPSTVCERQRRLEKEQKADATRKAEGTTLNGSLATNEMTFCICHHRHSLKAKQAGRV